MIPSDATRSSPLSRMNAARRVKSPFSQSALFGFGSLAAAMVASFWFVWSLRGDHLRSLRSSHGVPTR